MSAPVMPTVARASRSKSTSSASGTSREWTSNSSRRPASVGRSTVMCRSNRPGRSSAGSSTSGRFVAASTITVLGGAEAVHFAEDLVERLLALVVPAAEAGAALPADGVDFVDEHDRRASWPARFGTSRARGRRRRRRTSG